MKKISNKVFTILTVLSIFSQIGFSKTTNSVRTNKESDVFSSENKIIITATKSAVPVSDIGTDVTVINRDDIEKKLKYNVYDLLEDEAGISLKKYTGFGGKSELFLRGTSPGHTMVLIDGVEANNPIKSDSSFNFANLTTDNIERIEIVRGPQSSLYGSDAIGGIINIITKKGKGERPDINLSFEGGSYNTFREYIGINGGIKKFNYSLGVSRIDSRGISKAAKKDVSAPDFEKDKYNNTTISSRFGVNLFKDTWMNLYFRYNWANTDIDDGANRDDPNKKQDYKNLTSKIDYTHPVTTFWDYKIAFSYLYTRYTDEDNLDNINTNTSEYMNDVFRGENLKTEWQNNFYIGDKDIITAGIEYEFERAASYNNLGPDIEKTHFNNIATYLQNQIILWKSFYITTGLRLDKHDLSNITGKGFKPVVNYRASLLYKISKIGMHLKSNFGTGYKAPTIYNLFSDSGDINLKPEKSMSTDVGIEQYFLKKMFSINVIYFYNDFKELIEYDSSTKKYNNIGRSRIMGIEAGIKFRLKKLLTISCGYTFTDARDKDSWAMLLDRPIHKVNTGINLFLIKKINLNLKYSYIGQRYARGNKLMDGINKLDFAASYQVIKMLKLFFKIENMLNIKTQYVSGFSEPGISFYGGFSMKI